MLFVGYNVTITNMPTIRMVVRLGLSRTSRRTPDNYLEGSSPAIDDSSTYPSAKIVIKKSSGNHMVMGKLLVVKITTILYDM